MSSNLVLLEETKPGVVTLTLNDPESRNAMGVEMAAEFAARISELKNRADLRLLLLTGAGKAFSAGGNLEMLENKTKLEHGENKRLMKEFYDSFLCLREIPVPVVAALNGHAVGAGLCVALGCDVRIVKDTAKLGLNFVRLALHPGMGATYFLPRIVGAARAAELLYRGSIFSAKRAEEIGLVNHCVAESEFDSFVEEVVDDILSAGPKAVRALKRNLLESETSSLEECLQRESLAQADDYAGEEFKEGIRAAREKRKPNF